MHFASLNKIIYNDNLDLLPPEKTLINTINAYSYNNSQIDEKFAEVLMNSSILLPDGISVVWAIKLLNKKKIKRIAGADLFAWEMERLNKMGGKCFFLGSTNETLHKIRDKLAIEYPNVMVDCFSPNYKPIFSVEESNEMLEKVNEFGPDVLFIGMTAPKQEKWAYEHFDRINAIHVCTIGAVFDFYAGNIKRAPLWAQKAGFEWLFRLVYEPKRMWKRYLVGNSLFIYYVLKEYFSKNSKREISTEPNPS